MSLLGLAIGSAIGGLLSGSQVLYRSIGGIVAPCTIVEHHSDTMTITDHPIEIGTTITDHSFMNPIVVDIAIAWGTGVNIPVIYTKLLMLQASRKPFAIYTGKRLFERMLIQSMVETTDTNTENILRLELTCRQVFLVSTSAASIAPAANQANPSSTADTQSRGTVQIAQSFPYSSGSAIIGKPI